MNEKYVVNDNIWIVGPAMENLVNIWILNHPQASDPWAVLFPTANLYAQYQDGRHPLSRLGAGYQLDMLGLLSFIAELCSVPLKPTEYPLSMRGSGPDGLMYHINLVRTMGDGERINKILGWDQEKFDRWIRYHLTFDKKEAE